jgi:stage III sporulation protein AD
MQIAQIVVLGVMAAVLSLTVKRHAPEIALLITVAASILIFFMVLPLLAGAVGVVNNIGGFFTAQHPYITLIVRILGIAYVAELGAQVCADAGEGAIASRIEMAGKVMIIAVAAPVLLDVLQMIAGLMP